MASLDDFLRLELRGSPVEGSTPLAAPARPTASGLQWLTAPSEVAGLAYRYIASSLERLQVSEEGATVTASCPLDSAAVQIAASPDGRLVAVACIDGSIRCYDSTASNLKLRWTAANAHSHVAPDASTSPSSDRSNAAAASGPVRSLSFSPSDYDLLMVDNTTLKFYNAAASQATLLLSVNNVTSADWSSTRAQDSGSRLAVGKTDGSIEIFNFASSKLESISQLGCPSEEEGFACTHLDWTGDTLVAGLCRVTPSDDEPDDDDEDDTAEHEAALFVTTLDTASYTADTWAEMGDVVPFFTVPRSGRHVYFTSVLLSAQNLVIVAANVGSDVGALAQDGSEWHLVEFQEGATATTPTDEEDEFYFPTGVQVVQLASSAFRLLLAATDGSLSVFSFENENDPSCFAAAPPSKNAATLPNSAVAVVEADSPPELAAEPAVSEVPASAPQPAPASAFSFGATGASPFTFGAAPANSTTENKSVFGFGGATAATPAFGSGTSTGLTFGSGSGTPFSFGAPGFGQTSTLGGAPSTSSPESKPSGPSFGSTTFGASAPAAASGGFGALASASSQGTGIFASNQFNAFDKPVTSPMSGIPVKPLFGATPTPVKAASTTGETPKSAGSSQSGTPSSLFGSKIPTFGSGTTSSPFSTFSSPLTTTPMGKPLFGSPTTPLPAQTPAKSETPAAPLTAAGKKAAAAFDSIDESKSGVVLTDKFEDLLDELGEGFHGDEFDAQVKLLDPSGSKKITRTMFIDWYTNLAEGGEGDDDDSLDSEEKAERAEEETKARAEFGKLSKTEGSQKVIQVGDMEKLITALGSTYDPGMFSKVLKKLAKADDKIYESDFVNWYMSWLFDDDGSDFDDDEEDAPDGDAGNAPGVSQGDLSSIFKVDKDSWKCDVCSVRNPDNKKKCLSCETVRPGYENDPEVKGGSSVAAGSAGGVGFSFGAASTSSGAIGSGGFTFGGAATGTSGTTTADVKGATPSGGFTFGAPAAASTGSGFSFGATPSGGGFTFGGGSGVGTSSGGKSAFESKTPGVEAKTTAIVSAESKKAAAVFDAADKDKTGSLPLDKFEDLLDELGEGFHGDEFDAQVKLLDTSGSKKITRTMFIEWYTNLAEGGEGDDDDSLDSEEKAERAEEEAKARTEFGKLSKTEGSQKVIQVGDMEKLITALGSTYDPGMFSKVLKKLAKADDKIYESDFVNWYMSWLFDDDGSDFDDDEEDAPDGDAGNAPGVSRGDLSSIFKVDKDSWKCDVCSVRNPDNKKKCLSCETVRPGYENDPEVKGGSSVAAGSAGGVGFSFGAASTSSGAIGSGGFTFGGAATGTSGTTTADVKGATPSGGFTFGAPAAASTGSGFSFGATPSGGGFTFGGGSGVGTSAVSTPTSGGKSPLESKTPRVEPKIIAIVSAESKKAAAVFDAADKDKTGSLPLDKFEDLLDELGEGFHGDEFDAQVKLLDPSGSKKITRTMFIEWYTKLAEGGEGDDDDSLDSEEKAERAEEETKARAEFGKLSKTEGSQKVIQVGDMEKLITALGSTYDPGMFSKVLKKLAKADDKIYESDFVNWYMSWLFDDDGSDFDDDEEDAPDGDAGNAPGVSQGDLSSIFKVDKDSWKCDVCSVRNPDNKKKCLSCETVRPGYENDPEVKGGSSVAAGSAGGVGFSFGAASTSSGAIGSGGFTFGGAATAASGTTTADVKGATPSGGFTFGAPAAASTGSGFSFGATPSGGGFTFGGGSAVATSNVVDKAQEAAVLPNKVKPTTDASSSYPPMSTKAPTPFATGSSSGSNAKASTGSSNSSAFPPMSSKAPTPFGGVKAPAPVSASFPPMSTKAPTPFSAGKAPAPATASSYPPLSATAPKPFGGGVSATKPETKSSSSAAFPPMSTKAPTPFSAGKAPAPATASSYPPMSATAPKPFGGGVSATKPETKSSSSAAFPPMSTKAPTPFSAGKAPAPATASSYPPMSATAPKPFGGGVSATKPETKSSSSAAFPPMSTKAPTPFSAGKAPAPATASSYPPMSSTAPKPFGGGVSATKPETKSSSSAAFPPMSTKAPTPFSAGKAPAPATASSYPPMSSTAPKPFGGGVSATKPETKSSSSAAFPPMSTKAPTPFSAGKAPTPATSSSAFPPMSTKAPTPFSAGKAPAPSSSSSSYPPLSTTAPTPFGGSSAKAPLQNPLTPLGGGTPGHRPRDPSDSRPGSSAQERRPSSSPAENEFSKLESAMDDVVSRVHGICQSASHKIAEIDTKMGRFVDKKNEVANGLASADSNLTKLKERSTFLLSRKTDASRQVREARELVEGQLKGADGAGLAESQPLDFESEQTRRKHALSARLISEQMHALQDRFALVSSIVENPQDSAPVLRSVCRFFEETKKLGGKIQLVEKKLEETSKLAPLLPANALGRSTYGLSPPKPHGRKREKLRPLTIGHTPTKLNSAATAQLGESVVDKWEAIESSLQNQTNEQTKTVRIAGLSTASLMRKAAVPSHPTQRDYGRSLLLSPDKGTVPQQLTYGASSTASVFSPPSKSRPRAGWDQMSTIDQNRAKMLSTSIPQGLKEVTVTDQAREKLAAVGTTPEKLQAKLEISRGAGLERVSPRSKREQSSDTSSSTGEARKSSEGMKKAAAAFPPMSSKAPTPFSQKTREKEAISPPKATSGTSYPPLSSAPPKNPFSMSKSADNTIDQAKAEPSKQPLPPTKEPVKGNAPSFGDMSGLGNSLFSLGGNSSTKEQSSFPPPKPTSTVEKGKTPDYRQILTSFYQQHNPSKVQEVDKHLEKYKGREVEMFNKLAAKYNVRSPLDESIASSSGPSAMTSTFGSSNAPAPSPFSSGSGSMQTVASSFTTTNANAPSPSPFGAPKPITAPSPAPSPFGTTAPLGLGSASAFGSSSATSSPFGSSGIGSPSPFGGTPAASQPSLFGSSAAPSQPTPFGSAAAAPQPSPFGSPAPTNIASNTSQRTFQGRNPREILLSFYQQMNPSKIAEVDKVLQKYGGSEDQLFRNLAKKYNMDPSVFVLTGAPPASAFGAAPTGAPPASAFGAAPSSGAFGSGFGQQSALGGSSPFGMSSGGGFGQPSALGGAAMGTSGGPTFGSASGSAFGGGGPSFGALASSPSPFGAPSPGAFGSSAPSFGSPPPGGGFGSPFGAPRR